MDDIIPSLKTIPGTYEGNNQYFFPTDWGLTSVLYRADLAPEYVDNESWGLLWDPKYKGRLSMADSLIDGVMVAAIYIGAKDPFNMTDDEMAKTRAALKEQLPLMRYYWTSARPTLSRHLPLANWLRLPEPVLRCAQKGRVGCALYQPERRRHDLGLRFLPDERP